MFDPWLAWFNTTGDVRDLRFILSKIRKRFPYNSLYGTGISAGTSLLARYLGGTSRRKDPGLATRRAS